jgi:anti-sigma factor RsiW
MDHSEAIEAMATERYLLDELTPELREAFEQHVFDCPECALDLKAGAMFVEQAKAQLPQLTQSPTQSPAPIVKKQEWFAWLRPFFANPLLAGPVFAALLVIVGYQNLVVYPAMRTAANEPRVVPLVALHATRAAGHLAVEANRKQGVGLVVDLPQDAGYPSYAFELYDAKGKAVWTKAVLTQNLAAAVGDGAISVTIPGGGLQTGTFTLAVYGVAANGERSEVNRHILDLHFND